MNKAKLAFGGVAGGLGSLLVGVMGATHAFAVTDYSNMFAPAQTEGIAAVTQVIPEALAVGVLILGVGLGWKLFRRIAGR